MVTLQAGEVPSLEVLTLAVSTEGTNCGVGSCEGLRKPRQGLTRQGSVLPRRAHGMQEGQPCKTQMTSTTIAEIVFW